MDGHSPDDFSQNTEPKSAAGTRCAGKQNDSFKSEEYSPPKIKSNQIMPKRQLTRSKRGESMYVNDNRRGMVSSRRLRRLRCRCLLVFGGGGNECSAHRLYLSNSVGYRYKATSRRHPPPSSAISIFGFIIEYIIYTICTRIRKDSSLARVELLWSAAREGEHKTPRVEGRPSKEARAKSTQHSSCVSFGIYPLLWFQFARRACILSYIRTRILFAHNGHPPVGRVFFFGSRDGGTKGESRHGGALRVPPLPSPIRSSRG